MRRLGHIATSLTFLLLAPILLTSSPPAHAQDDVESANLATFVAVMQYIRSQPIPSDVNTDTLPELAVLDGIFIDLYVEGFIAPFTGETVEEAKARLTSVPEQDRFAAAMVETYRLSSNDLLLDIMHQLLAEYYVGHFTTAERSDAKVFLSRAEIQTLVEGFDSSDYAVAAPSPAQSSGQPSPSARTAADVQSANLATFVAAMQYIRSQPTPSDVNMDTLPELAVLDGIFIDLYAEGFIAPFTGETAEEARARLESVPEQDRFAAAMVETYRLSSNDLLLDIIHQLLAEYYVNYFTTADLAGAKEFLGKDKIQGLAAGFDTADYAIAMPSGTPTPEDTGSIETDRTALVKLYNATDGDNWWNNTNWLSDMPLGEWYGVTTDGDARVTELRLNGNQLDGEIPSELSNLSSLTRLHLGNNQLDGGIPSELGNLSDLTELGLFNNQLSGRIPSELASLSSLTWLHLDGNRLGGEIAPELGNLSSLISLDLSRNQLDGEIPSELGSLSNLKGLRLQNNRLTGPIPPQLSELLELRVLLLANNRLDGSVPAWLGELPNLRRLQLQGNRLTGTAPKLAPERTREKLELLPWIRDGLQTGEHADYDYLVRLADKYPFAMSKALDKNWLQDGVARTEFAVIESLGLLSADSLVRIIAMPFLERIDPADPNAAASLQQLENDSRDDFQRIMAHPTIADGIDDEEAKIVTLLYGTNKYRRELVEPLLSGTDVYLEERAIQLPLAGETLLVIIRVQDQPNRLIDYLEIGTRNMEMFVGEPLPTNYMAVLLPRFHPDEIPEGVWRGTHMTLSIRYDDPYWHNPDSGEIWAAQFAHEIAHYYFGSWFGVGGPSGRMRTWMAEGSAQFLGNSLSEKVRAGRPVAPTLAPCHSAKTIAELDSQEITQPGTTAERRADIDRAEEDGPPQNVDDRWLCNYTLGEGLFIDLYQELGEETFLRGMGNLYRKTLREDPSDDCEGTYAEICHLRHAFHTAVPPGDAARVKAIIDRWYYGE